jgi:predicted nucleic acid-binding protein
MNVGVFVDTNNVLVYTRDSSEPQKQKQAIAWMSHLWNTRTGRLSFQVLQEFYITVTAKLEPGLDPKSARSDVRSLIAWRPVPVDSHITEAAWLVQDRYKLPWLDSLIVSAAEISGCQYLLTEDFREGQKLGNLQVINPFHNSPASLKL